MRDVHPLTIGSVDLQRAGAGGSIGAAAKRDVLAAAQRYVNKAILAPLETGKAGRGYADLFVPGIRPAAVGADRAVLTDESVGKTATLNEESTPVAMSALTGPAGVLLYVATKFRLTVHTTRGSGAVTIDRNIELTFEPVNHDWLVTAYRIDVIRHTPARKATSTTRPTRRTTTTRKARAGAKP